MSSLLPCLPRGGGGCYLFSNGGSGVSFFWGKGGGCEDDPGGYIYHTEPGYQVLVSDLRQAIKFIGKGLQCGCLCFFAITVVWLVSEGQRQELDSRIGYKTRNGRYLLVTLDNGFGYDIKLNDGIASFGFC